MCGSFGYLIRPSHPDIFTEVLIGVRFKILVEMHPLWTVTRTRVDCYTRSGFPDTPNIDLIMNAVFRTLSAAWWNGGDTL